MHPEQKIAQSFVHVPRELMERHKLHAPDFAEEIQAEGVWLDDVFIVSRKKADMIVAKYKQKDSEKAAGNTLQVVEEASPDTPDTEVDNSVLRPIKNFAGSMKNWVSNGMPIATKEVYELRKSICDSCPFWDKDGNMGMGKCKQCGCTSAKLHLATEKCPVGKWGPVTKD
jgi:hypothetical protein